MGLSESEIRRYSRQILVAEIGGAGQERLLATGALVVGSGPCAMTALAYLGAGGVPAWPSVETAAAASRGFLVAGADLNATLRQANPELPAATRSAGALVEAPLQPAGPAPWVAMGTRADRAVVLARAEGGCPACFLKSLSELSSPPEGALSVAVGAAAALVFQRVVLGLSEPLEALTLGPDGSVSRDGLSRCPAHGVQVAPR